MTGIFKCLPVIEPIYCTVVTTRPSLDGFRDSFNNGPVVNVLVITIILFLMFSGRAFVINGQCLLGCSNALQVSLSIDSAFCVCCQAIGVAETLSRNTDIE